MNLSQKTANISGVIGTPFINPERAKEEFKELKDRLANKDFDFVTKWINGHMGLLNKAEQGLKLPDAVMKLSPTSAEPRTALLNVWDAQTNELELDTLWMPYYDMQGVGEVSYANIVSHDTKDSTWKKAGMNDKIQLSDFGVTTRTKIEPYRHVFGTGIGRFEMASDEWWNLNRIMSSVMIKNQSYKANMAYTTIGTTYSATTTAASTSLDDRVAAFDEAIVTLLERNDGEGFAISPQTKILLYYRAGNYGIINQILNREIGSETNNLVMAFKRNIVPIATFNSNLPSDNGGKPVAFLHIPRLNNKWVTFGTMRTAQETSFTTDSLEILAQEYFNEQGTAAQGQRIQLTP